MTSKSLYTIAGMGLASCVLLSMMMQQALKGSVETRRPAVAAELEDLFRGQLAGPVQMQILERDGKQTLRLCLTVAKGLKKQGLALSAGGVVWSRALEGGRIPDAVVVQVKDESQGATEEFQVPPPPLYGRLGPTPDKGRPGGG